MEERGNKTIICSVFFLDIVEYSKKSVAGQISQKERFNAFLSAAIRDVPVDDRIILDTGDGAAISFLGDVEDALRAALSMRNSLMSEEGLKDPPLLVRMGVNLGPVRLVRDINGQPNIVGDGINVAQRVMGFAEPGQILVSRSYYDAASRLEQEYGGMFNYIGSRTDKHVREHEVYAIGQPGDVSGAQKAVAVQEKSHSGSDAAAPGKFSVALGTLRAKSKAHWDTLKALVAHAGEKFKQASGTQKALYTGMAAIPFLLLLLVVKLVHKPEAPLNEASNNVAAVVPLAQSSVALASSAPVLASSTAKHATATHDAKSSAHLNSDKKKDKKTKTEAKADSKKKETAHQDSKSESKRKDTAQAKGGVGLVMLTVKPWGEVYLDGKMVDVSPPLTKLQVTAGAHIIQLKNANFPVYKQSINIKAGEKISINYKFAN